MLAALFVLGLFGYAFAYTGYRAITQGQAPGILESLSPSFTGETLAGRPSGLAPVSGVLSGAGAAIGGTVSGTNAAVTGGLAAMKAFVAARYPGRRFVIVSTFRSGAIVAGTSTPSEHGAGNAADVRIFRKDGTLDMKAMQGLYLFLKLTPYCELCFNGQGGCNDPHTDHLHWAPVPCRT